MGRPLAFVTIAATLILLGSVLRMPAVHAMDGDNPEEVPSLTGTVGTADADEFSEIAGPSGTGTGEDPATAGGPAKTVGVEADGVVELAPTGAAGSTPDAEPVAASDGGTFAGKSPRKPHPGGDPQPCLERSDVVITETGEVFYLSFPVCVGGRVNCGAVRIDDLYTGRTSGSSVKGAYAAYLTELATGAISGGAPVVDVDIDTNSTSIIRAGLGDEPSSNAMPVFNWCREQDDPQPFVIGHPEYGVNFAWATTIEAEYPITATLDNLYQKVRADIGLYKPDIATIPPVDRAATIVKFPTWLWVNNPFDDIEARATSDLNLIRTEVRGRLEHVEWHLGDHTLTCTPDEMKPYHDGDDPLDPPACHHIFTELQTFDFAATLHYVIEQRVTRRFYSTQPWPNLAWQPHTTNPNIELTTNIGPYQVRELRSLNVREEIAAGS